MQALIPWSSPIQDVSFSSVHGPALVLFYWHQCGHCRSFAPVFQEVARQIKGRVPVYAVDIMANKETGVHAVPRVQFWDAQDGRHDYMGPRTAEAVLAFVDAQTGGAGAGALSGGGMGKRRSPRCKSAALTVGSGKKRAWSASGSPAKRRKARRSSGVSGGVSGGGCYVETGVTGGRTPKRAGKRASPKRARAAAAAKAEEGEEPVRRPRGRPRRTTPKRPMTAWNYALQSAYAKLKTLPQYREFVAEQRAKGESTFVQMGRGPLGQWLETTTRALYDEMRE